MDTGPFFGTGLCIFEHQHIRGCLHQFWCFISVSYLLSVRSVDLHKNITPCYRASRHLLFLCLFMGVFCVIVEDKYICVLCGQCWAECKAQLSLPTDLDMIVDG